MRSQQIENLYVRRIDEQRLGPVNEIRGQGLPAEEFVARFYEGISGLKVRFSTPEEDKGPEIGGRQTVDLVVSFPSGKIAFATQVTSSAQKGVMEKKIKEIFDHPFVRPEGIKTQDLSIPKVLVSLDAGQVKDFFTNPNMKQHPEMLLKVIDNHITSLTFALSQTRYLPQQKEVQELIRIFTEEKKRYSH